MFIFPHQKFMEILKIGLKENHNFNPTTPYSVSRAACDMHLLSFYKAYDFPVIFTRAANVYGPAILAI